MRTFSLRNRRLSRLRAHREPGFRPRPAREGLAAGRRHGRLGERNPARRSARASNRNSPKVSLTGPGGAVPLGAAKTEPSNQAVLDRADHEGARGRRLQGALAGGVGRHAPHPGNLRIHGEAMTAAGRRSVLLACRRQRCERRICRGPVRRPRPWPQQVGPPPKSSSNHESVDP